MDIRLQNETITGFIKVYKVNGIKQNSEYTWKIWRQAQQHVRTTQTVNDYLVGQTTVFDQNNQCVDKTFWQLVKGPTK